MLHFSSLSRLLLLEIINYLRFLYYLLELPMKIEHPLTASISEELEGITWRKISIFINRVLGSREIVTYGTYPEVPTDFYMY